MLKQVILPPISNPTVEGTVAGGWWRELDTDGTILCELCPRACKLHPGDRGFCFVRENNNGQMLLTTYGRSTGFCIDPIEKKPLNHFLPGTAVLSFGTAGCNLGCRFCQNWTISKSRDVQQLSELATGQMIANAAQQFGCDSVAMTYNDPVIWAEYAIDVARACHDQGIKTIAVTAGYITELARGAFFEHIDAANVDLKGFSEHFYQKYTASHLQPVLDTLRWLKDETDVWFEITNLIIPQANDSTDELKKMCHWIVQHLGCEVPIHFTAFHPDFRLNDRQRTPAETLLQAREIAIQAGIQYAYVGNVDDQTNQSTYCPACSKLLIERNWYEIGAYHLSGNRCAHCDHQIVGLFQKQPGNWGRKRLPVNIAQFSSQHDHPNESQPPTQFVELTNPAKTTQQGAPVLSNEPPIQNSTQNQMTDTSFSLTEQQEAKIHRAACQMVADGVLGRKVQLSDSELGGAGKLSVLGAFVTLKRKERLRSCCGLFGTPTYLATALERSSQRTATEDVRLPPISPTELKYLSLDVWLLHSAVLISEKGESRKNAVKIGQHGLQIIQGQARGLLLPGVAKEHEMDAEQFLQSVSMKAGLPPTAWKDEQTQLITFEGQSIDAPFDTSFLSADEQSVGLLFDEKLMQSLAEFYRRNMVSLVHGATPNYYMPEISDGTVAGVSIRLHIPGSEHLPQLAKLSMRPGFPLQATLFSLCEAAAATLKAGQLNVQDLEKVKLGVTILYDPAMHGTVAEPDLAGFDLTQRALMVKEGKHSAWAYDPNSTPEEILEEIVAGAKITTPTAAGVYSLAVQSTESSIQFNDVPQAQLGSSLRPAAVAGTFYPAEAQDIEKELDQLFDGEKPTKQQWPAVMLPHAGWKYSGRIAAETLQQVELPDSIIVIGPKHTRFGVQWAVAPHETWQLPSGNVAADPQLAQELSDEIVDLQLDAAAHAREHAIEVELPLIARLAPQAKVTGIAIGGGNLDRCLQFAYGLSKVIKSRNEPTLLIISSDMNHFATDEENRRLDQIALEALQSMNPTQLYDVVSKNHISMCGVLPAVIVLETLRHLEKLTKTKQVAYTTSAEITGDKSRVVGYAGMLIG